MRRSWNVSNATQKLSLLRSMGVSRRISLATQSAGGAVSHRRALTYMFAASNIIQASVFSVAGAPSSGINCTKSEIARTHS